ncbi:uncharacterized protein BcabD6B2_43150 [Babesia caballi]|uniref:Uncharacterized protein n=1 Tax=Babesia caballi TaxID=5871 RepID=A0AAV4LZ03_BABCB|nr:hypothetical protein BcabD6B2_43150 [Babesia caballi]
MRENSSGGSEFELSLFLRALGLRGLGGHLAGGLLDQLGLGLVELELPHHVLGAHGAVQVERGGDEAPQGRRGAGLAGHGGLKGGQQGRRATYDGGGDGRHRVGDLGAEEGAGAALGGLGLQDGVGLPGGGARGVRGGAEVGGGVQPGVDHGDGDLHGGRLDLGALLGELLARGVRVAVVVPVGRVAVVLGELAPERLADVVVLVVVGVDVAEQGVAGVVGGQLAPAAGVEAEGGPLGERGVHAGDLEVGVAGRRAEALHVDEPGRRGVVADAQGLPEALAHAAGPIVAHAQLHLLALVVQITVPRHRGLRGVLEKRVV